MPSNNSKYSDELRERTAKFVLESGKSATSVAEEMGIDKNTVCRWIRDYRRKHYLPSYAESKGIKQATVKIDREASRKVSWYFIATVTVSIALEPIKSIWKNTVSIAA